MRHSAPLLIDSAAAMPEPAIPGDDRCLAGLAAALAALPGAPLERVLANLADALAVDAIVLLAPQTTPTVRTIAGRDRRVPGDGELPAGCRAALADGRLVRGGPELAAALVRPQGDAGAALIAPLPGPSALALALYTNLSAWTWTSGQELALRGFVGGLAGWLTARDLQAVLDALPQRISWKDAGLRYRGVNQAFTRASRQPVTLGRADADIDVLERDVAAGAAAHGPRLESALLAPGREQWFWTSRAPLDGGGVVVVRDDITATVTLAAQLAQASRTAAIGQLAAGVGNDLRPISARITAEVAAARNDPAAVQGALDRIDLAAQSAEDLARQLATFSRRQLLQPVDIVPVQLLTRMEPTLDRLLGERVELRLAAVGLRCTVRVDPRLFEQLLAMLARHVRVLLGGRGSLDVDVAADTLDPAAALTLALPAGEYVRVRLVATPGPRQDDAAFEADPPHIDPEHGLHLALVRTIAGQAGGGVLHLAEPDGTTRIDVHLPRVFAARSEPETRPLLDVRGGETLLLVEDDPVVRSLLITVLRHLGYHVLAADDVEAAAQQLGTGPNGQVQTARVALALVSAALPGQRPADALRRLRAAAPELRVVWISPGAPTLSAASDPLVVPCSFEALAVRVRQALDARA